MPDDNVMDRKRGGSPESAEDPEASEPLAPRKGDAMELPPDAEL